MHHTHLRRIAEVGIAVRALNRMLELGRPDSARIAQTQIGLRVLPVPAMQHGHGRLTQTQQPPANPARFIRITMPLAE